MMDCQHKHDQWLSTISCKTSRIFASIGIIISTYVKVLHLNYQTYSTLCERNAKYMSLVIISASKLKKKGGLKCIKMHTKVHPPLLFRSVYSRRWLRVG